jgi:hypothetical protein
MPAITVPTNQDLASYKKVLFVLKGMEVHPTWEKLIAGAPVGEFDFFSLSLPKRVLLSKSYVEYFKANPRSAEYMLDAGLQIFDADTKPDVLVDTPQTNQAIQKHASRLGKIWQADAPNFRPFPGDLRPQLAAAGYDCIVLLYPDSIGASWSNLERKLASLAPTTLALNGRRRLFYWDAAARRMLAWRRFLQHYWLAEIVAVPLLIAWAAVLAVYDMTFRKLLRRSSANG